MSAKEILQSIINDFDISKFEQFFRQKNDKLNFPYEDLSVGNLDNFSDGKKIAKANLEDGDLIICSILVKKELTERSGKKFQYEIGKQILKQQQADAGIFIFYDSKGDFRFSLIYTNYLGKRRDWSTFKRFTYFVSKNQTNKTFLKQIGDGDLSSIEKIKEAFSVEKVTKEFYDEIQSWYFWAIQHSKFPKDAEKEKNGRNEAIIRLITRMIFIWFMRERGLVPKKLFEQKNIEEILKSVEQNDSTYYLAILQNLFFATLNTKKEERRFRSESRYRKGWNEDFGNQYVYRYFDLFKNPEKIEEYFGDIPFLNGGLFDCLDDGKDDIYIDGFTERKKYQPQVPNFLFFGEETEIDLNTELGTKNKKYKVKGLLNILSAYNFTIDENSLDDADIALDPELLGRVFENLLANYNPETATTARKSTGSYYTPREIVDYMVIESLKEYFKTHLPKIKNTDDKLEKLFSIETTGNPFNKLESEQLVKLIESVRIVDPAVGSGAFPMGVLNKMVFILNKVDPDNNLWKQKQLEAADTIPDPQLKRNTKEQIEEFFKDKDADYGRKLYLIQKCIYGVDIQQIAVEITKLRFFISLLVDENIDKTKENYGIKPLPNLGFKIVQGNSLIEIISYTSTNDHKRNEMVNQLKKLKDELFSIASPEEKKKKRDEIDNLNKQVFEYDRNLIIDGLKQEIKSIQNQGRLFKDAKLEAEDRKRIEELKNKIEEVQKTKISDPSEHFEWHINFSEVFQEKGGFDIVIANPPYVSTKEINESDKKILEKQFGFADDLYTHFYFKGMELLKDHGVLSFITSKTFWTIQTKKNLRTLILRNKLLQLFNTANPFKAVMVDTCVILMQKVQDNSAEYSFIYLDGTKNLSKPSLQTGNIAYYRNSPNQVFFPITELNLRIYERYGKKVNELLNNWWDKISTSKNIEKYKKELEKYRSSLKPGDITLLGLITEGGQGLATANNGKYIGVKEDTKWAENVKKQRPEKLLLATEFCKQNNIKNKWDAEAFINKLNELEIRKLFDDIKEKYSRDIFGQGWLYRIVSDDEIADVDLLTDDEKLNGIQGDKTFVPYDKGDKDGNRWYAPTPYYIDWSRDNVKFLKENSGKKGEGMPVVRNPQFYFREGFCWNFALLPKIEESKIIKCRIKEKTVNDVMTMALCSIFKCSPNYYIVALLNSKFSYNYLKTFINSTAGQQINDIRQLPIIIPTDEQLSKYKDIFDRAVKIQKDKFTGNSSSYNVNEKLNIIQKELDEFVESMYLK